MLSRTHYPVIKKLFLVQIASIVVGVLCIYLIMVRHAAGVLAAAVEKENARVASRIEENQERWRAWFELGMTFALERELDVFKREFAVKSIRVVNGKSAHEVEGVERIGAQQKQYYDVSYVAYELDHNKIRNEIVGRSGTVTVVMAVGVLLLIMVIYSTWYVRSYIYSPLSSMIRAFDRMERTGTLCLDDVRGKGEIARFIEEFRSMHKRIKESEKLRAESEISRHIAHDMRSPLAVLKSYIESSTHQANSEGESFRQAAERSVGKLLHMAEDLVDYAKATKITKFPTEISELICKGVIPEVQKRGDGVHVAIRCDVRERFRVDVDAAKIERTLVNLANNSVEALDEAGEVIVGASPGAGTELRLTVRDNGKGIPEMDIPHVFDSFFTKGKKGGTGLGLAYCKQVVEAHGGTIEVESEVGKGATFTITIPNCVVDAHQGAALRNEPPIKCENRRFLIMDDDTDIRKRWRRIIEDSGGVVVGEAGSLEEIQQRGRDIPYDGIDIAVVDYHYEGSAYCGTDVIAFMRKRGIGEVHLCTGFHDDEQVRSVAFAAGVSSVIPKC